MKKTISLTLIVLLLLPLLPVYATYLPQYESEAKILYNAGLFRGNDTGFDLDKECDRVQAAVFFIRLMGKEKEALENPKHHPFLDVSSWANPYIGQMYYEGYTKGISSTEYGTGNITADQFATFCLRALGYSENASDWKKFEYNNAMNKMLEENIISKNDYSTINSSDIFFRDFAVKLMYNTIFEPGKNNLNKTLVNRLIESGITIDKNLTEDSIIYEDENFIELDSSEDIYALSRILASDWLKSRFYTNSLTLSLEKDFERFPLPKEITSDKEKIEYLQNASYILLNDIKIVLDTTVPSDTNLYTSEKFFGIGNYHYPFKGNFNGNGKTITLSAKKDLITQNYAADNIGFFGDTVDADIYDTKILVSSDITATHSNTSDNQFAMGTLIGEAKTTNITNCSATFTNADFGLNNSNELFEDYGYIGGLIGRAELSTINNCTVESTNSRIYGEITASNLENAFGGISVGGILGMSGAGSNNTTNIGRLGSQLYNCRFISENTTQQDIICASLKGGTESTVGGIVGITYNNGLIKNCSVDVKKGNITSNQTDEVASSARGSAVGGIIGRMEHTGQIIGCEVKGDYLNISTIGPDNTHLVGGIAGNAYGPIHRLVTPILNCHFDGSGTSIIAARINTLNLKESSHTVAVGGIAGYLTYQMYDSSSKNVKIINDSKGMKKYSGAGELVGIFEKACHTNGTWEPGPIEISGCTSVGVSFDISDNVIKTNH